MLTSCIVNVCFLGIAAANLYAMDAKVFVKLTNSFLIILLSVPILTWIDCFVIMQKSKA